MQVSQKLNANLGGLQQVQRNCKIDDSDVESDAELPSRLSSGDLEYRM